jgi:hypothetical protein
MDNDTRFILAMQISKKRGTEDARKVFAEARRRANMRPRNRRHRRASRLRDAFKRIFHFEETENSTHKAPKHKGQSE